MFRGTPACVPRTCDNSLHPRSTLTQDLHPIVIKSTSFGKLSGVTIYVTQDLFDRLSFGDGSRNPLTVTALENGRALKGLKHLIERIQNADPEAMLVLTLDETHREGQAYFVNFDDYRQITQGRFFDLYRSAGQEASLDFLGEHFPADFEQQASQLSEAHLRDC